MSYELKHRTTKRVATGKKYPLGAALQGDGVNFAVYSKHAAEVFLLLFDRSDGEPTDIIKKLAKRDKFIWHEFARTQRGNNNAYCQDNEIRWFDWTSAARNSDSSIFFAKQLRSRVASRSCSTGNFSWAWTWTTIRFPT